MIAAVELRKAPTQCNFQPLLKQGAPAQLRRRHEDDVGLERERSRTA